MQSTELAIAALKGAWDEVEAIRDAQDGEGLPAALSRCFLAADAVNALMRATDERAVLDDVTREVLTRLAGMLTWAIPYAQDAAHAAEMRHLGAKIRQDLADDPE